MRNRLMAQTGEYVAMEVAICFSDVTAQAVMSPGTATSLYYNPAPESLALMAMVISGQQPKIA